MILSLIIIVFESIIYISALKAQEVIFSSIVWAFLSYRGRPEWYRLRAID